MRKRPTQSFSPIAARAASSVRPTEATSGWAYMQLGVRLRSHLTRAPRQFSAAMRPMAKAACVSIILPVMSPQAYTFGTPVSR